MQVLWFTILCLSFFLPVFIFVFLCPQLSHKGVFTVYSSYQDKFFPFASKGRVLWLIRVLSWKITLIMINCSEVLGYHFDYITRDFHLVPVS